MGVRRLASTLEPYAVHRRLQDESVVIDGPALAYHIASLCTSNGVRDPSYALLGQIVAAWLDGLASNGIIM